MLQKLTVNNIAIIQEVEVALGMKMLIEQP